MSALVEIIGESVVHQHLDAKYQSQAHHKLA